MKSFLLLFLFIFSIHFSSAQQNFEFVGFIKLNDSSLISLTVNLKESNGNLSGYTLTDVGGEHETKTSITGKYSSENKILKFKEVETIYTKSSVTENDFCYVNFTSNSFKLGKSSKLKGDFKGLFPDNTECINGEILLTSKEKQLKKIEKAKKFIKKTKRISEEKKKSINIDKIMDSVQMNILRSKQTMSVFAKSKDIRIEIFDGGKLDGDKITLKFNNTILLRNFETQKERKSIPVTLVNKKNSLILLAENVGSISTNTAVIEIFVDNIKIKALTNLNTGEQTQIDFYLK